MSDRELVEDLARQVIDVLDKQREYFRTRSTELLTSCRAAESSLRNRCQTILRPTKSTPTLFDHGGES